MIGQCSIVSKIGSSEGLLKVNRSLYGHLLIVGIWAIFFAFCEVAVRLVWGNQFVYYSNYQERPIIYNLKPYGPALAPGFEDTLYNYKIYDVGVPLTPWKIKINQSGWREPEYPLAKPAGVKRLMILGDSVTYGMALDYRLTQSSFLAYGLKLDKSVSWQVLNRSVPGWDGWNELEYFTGEGYLWQPDVVIVNVVMNDFRPISDDERASQLQDAGYGARVSYFLFSNSRFLNMARVLWMKLNTNDRPEFFDFHREQLSDDDYGRFPVDKWWYIRGVYNSQAKEDDYQLANKISFPRYLKLADCKKNGIDCLVVIYPTASQTSLRYWTRQTQDEEILKARPIQEFATWLGQHNIPYINLLAEFRQAEEKPLFVDEIHLSAYGHMISAKAVLNYLSREKIANLYAEPFWVTPE